MKLTIKKKSKKLTITLISIAAFVLVSAYFSVWPILSEHIFGSKPSSCTPLLADQKSYVVNYTGFVTAFSRYGTNNSFDSMYEFVLSPGTAGQITKTYKFGPYTEEFFKNHNPLYSTPYQYFTSVRDQAAYELYTGITIPQNKTGVTLSISKITNSSNYSITETYTITADSSAKRTSYGLDLKSGCFSDILTIGNTPYLHSLPSDAVYLY